MVGAEEWGEGLGPATGAKILFGPGTGGILWVQWSGVVGHLQRLTVMLQSSLGISGNQLLVLALGNAVGKIRILHQAPRMIRAAVLFPREDDLAG
jgi:hypothetical protein